MNNKDFMKRLSVMTNDEIEQETKRLIDDGMPKELIKPLWEDEMLKDQIKNTTEEDIEKFCESLGITSKPISLDILIEHEKNSPERKKRLMRLEKEMLVDMVFNLESRNEFLLHNLSEVEKMYNNLKKVMEEKENG